MQFVTDTCRTDIQITTDLFCFNIERENQILKLE